MFYFLVLLSAVSWRLAGASSKVPQLNSAIINEKAGETDIVLSLNHLVKPSILLAGKENCLILDFPDTLLAENLYRKALVSRDLKLGYLVRAETDIVKTRVRLFIRPECLASIRYSNHDVIIRLAEKIGMNGHVENDKVLLNPQENRNSPAVISLQDAPFRPALLELASHAGIDLQFAGRTPENFSLELEASSPLEALQGIADVCSLRFYRDGKVWYMAGT